MEPLVGEQGVVAECWAHPHRQESSFLVAFVPCIPCVVPRPASRAARLAASLLRADLELSLLLPTPHSKVLLEAPD